jgi:hypothetical protein
LNQIDPLKRSVDLFRKYQRGVLEFALTLKQCAFAKIASHYRGADHNRCNQRHAAEDEIADGTIAPRRQPESGTEANLVCLARDTLLLVRQRGRVYRLLSPRAQPMMRSYALA